MYEQLSSFDFHLFLYINSFNSPLMDTIMEKISSVTLWLPLYLVILGYIFYKYKWKTGVFALIAMVLLVVLTDQTSVHLFKNTIQRLRPCHQPRISHLVHIVNNHCGGLYGFVSSHAANTFGFATFTALFFYRKVYSYFIFAWALLIGYSRIYLGVHYPSDIVGGALLGMFWAVVVYAMYVRVEEKLLKDNLRRTNF